LVEVAKQDEYIGLWAILQMMTHARLSHIPRAKCVIEGERFQDDRKGIIIVSKRGHDNDKDKGGTKVAGLVRPSDHPLPPPLIT
jgi:hypothetical protein